LETLREFVAPLESLPQDKSMSPPSEGAWLLSAIYDQILLVRSAAIQEIEDPFGTAKFSEQTIGCLEMEEVPTEECPCAPPSGCKWFRTILDVPEPILDYKAVTSIGGNLGNLTIYTYRDWYQIQFSLHARLEAERERPYYTKKNRKIYVAGKGHGEPISVTSIFYDPIEVQRLPLCGGIIDDCKPFLDYPIYIDPSLKNAIIGGVVKQMIGFRSPAGHDTTTNAQPAHGIEGVKP
jgi:hypothetical protein